MSSEFEAELAAAIDRILRSSSPKKLIVAGPGTGKTTLFRKALAKSCSTDEKGLALTFINNLKDELEETLSDLARVFTFHGYCHYLLRHDERLRSGLTEDFRYFPGLASLIKRDWHLAGKGQPPPFVDKMRQLDDGAETNFYLERSDYYDAVEFDDSVFRTYRRLVERVARVENCNLVLVDEYQDFNRMEAAFIDLLAAGNPILIVGDDDQALYSRLRGSSHDFIRNLYQSGEYELFELPFCMRCPEVVVQAIEDIVGHARDLGKLDGRIPKPFRFYPPVKGSDSARYPRLKIVETSTQSQKANYFGRYLERAIRKIPRDEIEQSREKGFPTVLIIGPRHYLGQIEEHLRSVGFDPDSKADQDATATLERADGLEILAADEQANLGWRIVVEIDHPRCLEAVVRRSLDRSDPLVELLPDDYKHEVLKDVYEWRAKMGVPTEYPPARQLPPPSEPTIKLTSFEGSKGLQAQHVFVVGMHDGDLPRNPGEIADLEICRFIVALTRTRMQCTLMYTNLFAGKRRQRSVFLNWIRAERKIRTRVDREYWQGR